MDLVLIHVYKYSYNPTGVWTIILSERMKWVAILRLMPYGHPATLITLKKSIILCIKRTNKIILNWIENLI